MQENTIQKVKRYAAENRIFEGCGLVIAGVSGGPDSMTMLHILDQIRRAENIELRVVHVNHGIRGEEADRDQKMVEDICMQWDIPCSVYAYDVPHLAQQWKLGLEETGRKVRRQAFADEKEKSMFPQEQIRIALAHNMNDMAETMLHHLARGTGLRGLASLKPVNAEFVHPLLCLERREIVDYVKERQIPSITDSSNLEDEYTRNRIRRHILPIMESEINPRTIEHMAETSEMLGQAEAYFAKKAKVLCEQYRTEDGCYLLDKAFFEKEAIIQTYVIREMLERTGGHQRDLTSGHIRQVQNLYLCRTGKKISLPYGIEARHCYEGVRIQKTAEDSGEKKWKVYGREAETLLIPGETEWEEGLFSVEIFPYNGEKILEKKYTKWFDCDRINCRLSVRNRRSGDYMIVDQEGRHKKITRCMIDDKIPAERREEIPLVTAGAEVLWIVGGRISEGYKITSRTGNVLQITYKGGNYYE